MGLKYISFNKGHNAEIVIFGNHNSHYNMARNFDALGSLLGAGFVEFYETRLKCYGFASSLQVGVHEGDQELLDDCLNQR